MLNLTVTAEWTMSPLGIRGRHDHVRHVIEVAE